MGLVSSLRLQRYLDFVVVLITTAPLSKRLMRVKLHLQVVAFFFILTVPFAFLGEGHVLAHLKSERPEAWVEEGDTPVIVVHSGFDKFAALCGG